MAYHNAEKWVTCTTHLASFAFFSRKLLTVLEWTLASWLWVINGSWSKAHGVTYTLCAVYQPEEVVDAWAIDFDYLVIGSVGHDIEPAIAFNQNS